MPAPLGIVLAVAISMLTLAACGSSASTGLPGSPPPTATLPPSAGPSPSPSDGFPASASPSGGTSPGASPTGPIPSAGSVAPDPALLAVLPATLGGLTAQPDPARDAELAGDADLAGVATGLATALYIDPTVGDFAYATVVRLRDGALDDPTYAAWRASFDEGACSQAGGVDGHAEATIGGHDTYIGTCAGGVRTYHTILEGGLLVSVSSLGEARLGEQVIGGLQPSA